MSVPDRLAVSSAVAGVDFTDLQIDNSISGWDIAFAVVSLVVAWILGRIARRTVLGVLARLPSGISEGLRRLLARIAMYFVWVIGVGVALRSSAPRSSPCWRPRSSSPSSSCWRCAASPRTSAPQRP